jgi:RNA 2',3'-cyclic 3'-phosphodiesterase
MTRLFLALSLSEEGARDLWDKWESARFSSPRIRWRAAEQYHITLLFFGNLEQTEIPVLCSVMDETAALYSSLNAVSEGPGQFPAKGNPRVFVEMLSEKGLAGEGQLASLQHFLYLNLKDKYPLEKRRFRPHITIARIVRNLKNSTDILLSTGAGFYDSRKMCYSLENLVLFESVLRPEGAVYSPVYSVKLKG